jgi:hypothetical protein
MCVCVCVCVLRNQKLESIVTLFSLCVFKKGIYTLHTRYSVRLVFYTHDIELLLLRS